MRDICVFGASITWGAWDSEKGGWVNRLRLFMDRRDEDAYVYNLSIPGDTTEDLLKRFDSEVEVREPNLVIFSIGGVDSMHIGNSGSHVISVDIFKKNVHELVSKAKARLINSIIVGLPNIDERYTQLGVFDDGVWYSKASVENYSNTLREVAIEEKIGFIDIINILSPEDIIDGLFPNEKGHEKIFQIVKNYLIEHKLIK